MKVDIKKSLAKAVNFKNDTTKVVRRPTKKVEAEKHIIIRVWTI